MGPSITAVARSNVYFGGESPPKEEFNRRYLQLRPIPDDSNDFRFGRALIIQVSPEHSVDRAKIESALDHGLLVLVVSQTDADLQVAVDALSGGNLIGAVTWRTGAPWWEIAERAARFDIQRAAGDVEISGDIPADSEFLLRRAFSDCKSLILERIGGGLSGAHIRRAYATFRDSAAGPRPLPFFLKIDTAERIKVEIDKYQIYVDRYIPFYLRPHLDYSRCVSSRKNGILVGDFVEHSEPLRSALALNRGRPAVNSLFDESLKSWRVQAFQASISSGNIPRSIYSFKPERFSIDRVKRAKEMGARNDPQQLIDKLYGSKDIGYRRGPIHGDLNCNNVQVRGGDAILIDFYTTTTGPTVADPACLEVDIVFSCDIPDGQVEHWKALADRLYGVAGLSSVPEPALEPTRHEWLWEAVRQIRMHGRSSTPVPMEYEQAVATYLLRRASYPAADANDEVRRTYAYLLADQIIRGF